MMSIQVTLKGRVGRGRQRNKTFLVSNIDNSTTTAKTVEAEGNQSTQCEEKIRDHINRWAEKTRSINNTDSCAY